MGLLSKINGVVENLFQLGLGGPKLKNNGGIIEARNAADGAYAIVRGDTPINGNDLSTKDYVDSSASPGAGRLITSTFLTGSDSTSAGTTGVYTPTSTGNSLLVHIQAGGGGGGGCTTGIATGSLFAAGGNGGGYVYCIINPPLAVSYTYTIGGRGNGGTGNITNVSAGGNGGTSIFGSCTAPGGLGGGPATIGLTTPGYIYSTAPAFTANGGQVNIDGWVGQPGIRVSGQVGKAGTGGNSYFGAGGDGKIGQGVLAKGLGAGGGGAGSTGTSGYYGGSGAPGCIYIQEYSG